MSSKSLDQELLRKRLRPSEYISIIEECMEWLMTHGNTATKNQIDAKKVIIDAAHKMLGKSLPDLRAIEIAPEREAPIKFIFQTGDSVDSKTLKRRLEGDEEPRFVFQ
jgi:hypothetical protein